MHDAGIPRTASEALSMLKPRFDPLRFSRHQAPSQEQRRQMIADAAYRRAQQRGFLPGGETQDWLAAEAEVDYEISYRYLNYYG
jgi:hypothetical protein